MLLCRLETSHPDWDRIKPSVDISQSTYTSLSGSGPTFSEFRSSLTMLWNNSELLIFHNNTRLNRHVSSILSYYHYNVINIPKSSIGSLWCLHVLCMYEQWYCVNPFTSSKPLLGKYSTIALCVGIALPPLSIVLKRNGICTNVYCIYLIKTRHSWYTVLYFLF